MATLHDGIVQPHQTRGDLRIDCDVVVVGSGAGGATTAATLAEAGLRVVVLEEGAAYTTAEYSADIPEMLGKLMRGGGSTVMMGRSPVPYLEGRCVGGTTVVNGGMCWRTPEHVLDAWVTERRLGHLSAQRLEPYFELVEQVIDARFQDPGSEGGVNDRFKAGADALGWKLSRNRRNQRHCVGSNDCVTGCPSGAKRSTAETWLPRFYAAGGRLFTHMKVERVLTQRGRATGVAGTLLDPYAKRRFRIEARAVVLSCGAIQTPLLLQKNRLGKPCGHVGRHFTIHPNIKMAARFDTPVDSMRGTHQAWQCVEFKETDGILLAPGAIPLAFMSAVFPSFGPRLAERMRDYRYIATGGILVDDHAEGYVKSVLGLPIIHYDVTDADQAKFVRAAALMAELYFAAGANEVYTPFHHLPIIESPDAIAKLYAHPPRVQDTEYFTAHLMGTCRMSSHPKAGVVDPNGEMWDVAGLYVADAGTMPGTIGVNPQVTIMALARVIAERLADRLGRKVPRAAGEAVTAAA
ncbi:MAG: GMC family oxidoreductase [Myxococcales bacterium]|nr:GMC family oxidoreductase [Myxococcales bacterium]MCB9540629.1 GMC family oxidoreductase [Myxococcales bacterium]